MVYDSNPLNHKNCESAFLPRGRSGWPQAGWGQGSRRV